MIIAHELTKEILDTFLKETNHKYNTAHSVLCYAIIKRIHRRLLMGYRFGTITVCQTKCLVVDGNHRFIAYSLAGIDVEVRDGTSSHCDVPKSFNDINIDQDKDWDIYSPEKKIFCNDDFLKDL